MQRREFITLFGVAAVTQGMLPQLACAQVSTKRPLLAVLAGVTRREFPVSFMEGMREFGYVEGGNIDVVYRFADGRLDLLPALAEELIQLTPKVIVAGLTPAAVAARRFTQTIPIVCPILADPHGEASLTAADDNSLNALRHGAEPKIEKKAAERRNQAASSHQCRAKVPPAEV